jgi:DNA repair protein RadC
MNHFFICDDPATFANPRPATSGEVIEAARHYALESLKREPFRATDTSKVCVYLEMHFAAEEREVFACLFLDNKHRLIAVENLFLGTVNQTAVYPREVVKRALYYNAAAVIAAHNHPSGDPTPSLTDIRQTEQLHDALKTVDIR